MEIELPSEVEKFLKTHIPARTECVLTGGWCVDTLVMGTPPSPARMLRLGMDYDIFVKSDPFDIPGYFRSETQYIDSGKDIVSLNPILHSEDTPRINVIFVKSIPGAIHDFDLDICKADLYIDIISKEKITCSAQVFTLSYAGHDQNMKIRPFFNYSDNRPAVSHIRQAKLLRLAKRIAKYAKRYPFARLEKIQSYNLTKQEENEIQKHLVENAGNSWVQKCDFITDREFQNWKTQELALDQQYEKIIQDMKNLFHANSKTPVMTSGTLFCYPTPSYVQVSGSLCDFFPEVGREDIDQVPEIQESRKPNEAAQESHGLSWLEKIGIGVLGFALYDLAKYLMAGWQ